MAETEIGQVKREIRVIGIAVAPADGDFFQVVGAVFRGGLWLDGVISTKARASDLTADTATMINTSRHHPQIRVILMSMTHGEAGAAPDPQGLSTMTSKPVILVYEGGSATQGSDLPRDMAARRIEHRRGETLFTLIPVGLRGRDAVRVIEVSTAGGTLPEALRVAKLIAVELRDCGQQKI